MCNWICKCNVFSLGMLLHSEVSDDLEVTFITLLLLTLLCVTTVTANYAVFRIPELIIIAEADCHNRICSILKVAVCMSALSGNCMEMHQNLNVHMLQYHF